MHELNDRLTGQDFSVSFSLIKRKRESESENENENENENEKASESKALVIFEKVTRLSLID